MSNVQNPEISRFALFYTMINDNPLLKPIYYSFLPSRLAISVLKSIPLGFSYKVIDDMDKFDIGKRFYL